METNSRLPLKQRHSLFIALAMVLACVFGLKAWALDSSKNLRQYVLRTWTSEQGLPQNSIRAMLQTHDGLLWIGTRGGLARFDGTKFTLYSTGDPKSVSGESITDLAEDRDGSLWISSNGGLSRYRDRRFQNFGSRDGLPSDSIWRIAADPAGGVWAVTWSSELFHFDGSTVRRYATPIPARPEEVNALLEDGEGTLWLATFDGLFARNSQGALRRFSHRDGLAGNRLYALALDREKRLWTAGDGGLSRQTSNGFVALAVPGLSTATLLAFDTKAQDDALWTGSTGQGVFRLNRGRVQRLGAAEGLVSDEVYLLYFSHDGSLWLGAVNGLNQLSDGAVTSYSTGEGVPTSTRDMQRSEGHSHELWFGRGKTLFGVNQASLIPIGLEHTIEREGDPKHEMVQLQWPRMTVVPLWVQSKDPSSQGLILAGRSGASVLWNGTSKRRLPAIPWSDVSGVLIDHNGMIWTAGSEIGVMAYSSHGPPRSYTVANGLDDNNVGPLAEDAAGDIWVGTLAGLNRIHHGVVSRVASCARVTSIVPSADGSLWVGSESGLLYVPPALAPVQVFAQQNGLPTSVVAAVAEDTIGNLWLGTQQGVMRVSKADLLHAAGGQQPVPVIFGTGDGFRNAQLRTNAIFRSHHGDIWFMTLQELAVIDPRAIQARALAPIFIDGVAVDDRDTALHPRDLLAVPPGRHRLTIRYALPEFKIPSRLRFRYRLEGWDKSWTEAGSLREATYTGIPPGHYLFHVINSDGYGNWSSAENTLAIRVEPYFYQTGWFLTLLAVLVFLCAWQLHRLRVAQVSKLLNERLQERLGERTRIARDLHDTLLQGMLGMAMQMYALSQKEHEAHSDRAMLGHASQRLREIAEQSRRTLEDLRSPYMSPDSLETALARALQEIDAPTGIRPQIKSAGADLRLRPLVQKEVEQIAREAIANAMHHSGASLLRVDIVYQPAHFFLSVTDDGCGLDPEIERAGRQGHWGLKGMRERADCIGAHLRLFPHTPSGTVVEVSLLGSLAYEGLPPSIRDWTWRQLLSRLRMTPKTFSKWRH